MVLTTNNDPTQRFTFEDARKLKEECDRTYTYSECGWFCVAGYKGDRRLVHAHCNSREEFDRMTSDKPFLDDDESYGPRR
jgi:hypothetical protein